MEQERRDLSDLALPPDERATLVGDVVGTAAQTTKWREVNGEIGANDLVNVLWPGGVSQAMLAQIDESQAGRRRGADQVVGGPGQEDLAAVCDVTQARAVVGDGAVVVKT